MPASPTGSRKISKPSACQDAAIGIAVFILRETDPTADDASLVHERGCDERGDLVEFDRSGEFRREFLEPVEQRELISHPLAELVVLDGQRYSVGHGTQFRRIRRLEGFVSASADQHQPERVSPDRQSYPREMAKRIVRQPAWQWGRSDATSPDDFVTEERVDRGKDDRSGG